MRHVWDSLTEAYFHVLKAKYKQIFTHTDLSTLRSIMFGLNGSEKSPFKQRPQGLANEHQRGLYQRLQSTSTGELVPHIIYTLTPGQQLAMKSDMELSRQPCWMFLNCGCRKPKGLRSVSPFTSEKLHITATTLKLRISLYSLVHERRSRLSI